MYAVSTAFQTAIKAGQRDLKARCTINGTTYTTDSNSLLSFYYTHGVIGDKFTIGQTPAAFVEINIKDLTGNFDGNTVTVEIGVDTDGNGTYEYCPMGTFYVEETVKSTTFLTLRCYDAMVKLETPFTSTSTSAATVLSHIMNGLSSSITLPSYLTSLTLPVLKNRTKRQVLGYIATMMGGFAYVDRSGTFKIKTNPITPAISPKMAINGDIYFKFDKEDLASTVEAVSIYDGSKQVTSGTVTSGVWLYADSPYVTASTAANVEAIVDGLQIQSYMCKFIGNPALELGDNIQIDEFVDDSTTNTLYVNIGEIELRFGGYMEQTIYNVGDGKNRSNNATNGELIARFGNISADNITSGTIDANTITVNNLNASNITGGTLVAARIAAGSLSGDKITAGTLTADRLVAGTITAASGVIGSIDASKITTGTLSANYISGGTLKLGGTVWGTLEAYNNSNVKSVVLDATGITFLSSGTPTYYFAPNAATLPSTTLTGTLSVSNSLSSGDVVPNTDNTYQLGSGTNRWTKLVMGAVGSEIFTYYTSSTSHSKFSNDASGNLILTMGTSAPAERLRVLSNLGYLLLGYTTSNGSYRLQVNSQIFATSATVATSDGRYKQNIKPIENALDIVNRLNPVQFNWKKHAVHNFDLENATTGFIAQEVLKTLDGTEYSNSIVKRNECEYEDADGNVVKEEFLGIAEGNLIAILTKAVQELNAKVDALR